MAGSSPLPGQLAGPAAGQPSPWQPCQRAAWRSGPGRPPWRQQWLYNIAMTYINKAIAEYAFERAPDQLRNNPPPHLLTAVSSSARYSLVSSPASAACTSLNVRTGLPHHILTTTCMAAHNCAQEGRQSQQHSLGSLRLLLSSALQVADICLSHLDCLLVLGTQPLLLLQDMGEMGKRATY